MSNEQHAFGHFAHSRAAQFAAFAWGVAEATVFFIVADVLLSAIGSRSICAGLKAVGLALVGALLGGMVMYGAGRAAPDASRNFLTHVPAIRIELIERVRSQLSEQGLGAVFSGPMRGIPYKIYAVEWGARQGNVWTFLLVSVPARAIRFVLSVLLANGVARLITPWTKRRPNTEMTILVLFWIAFYAFYFSKFGW